MFIPSFEFLGKATISNDGATIISLLDVVHPAAKTLVDISKSQDAEVCRFVSVLNVTLWQGVRANVFSFSVFCTTRKLFMFMLTGSFLEG